jgi:DNA-binding NarL/FixJ family response regulator
VNQTAIGSALIVEDHPLYRDALTHLLAELFDPSRIAAVSSAEEGLRAAPGLSELRVILLDPGLPGLSGVEAMAAFKRACPTATLIAISASDDRKDVQAALRAGTSVFVSKAASRPLIVDVLRQVLAGAAKTPQWVTPTGLVSLTDEAPVELTPRQGEILTLLCRGHSNKEIGLRLNLAEITVKVHVSSILRTLGVANRTQAVLMARKLGLHTPD